MSYYKWKWIDKIKDLIKVKIQRKPIIELYTIIHINWYTPLCNQLKDALHSQQPHAVFRCHLHHHGVEQLPEHRPMHLCWVLHYSFLYRTPVVWLPNYKEQRHNSVPRTGIISREQDIKHKNFEIESRVKQLTK